MKIKRGNRQHHTVRRRRDLTLRSQFLGIAIVIIAPMFLQAQDEPLRRELPISAGVMGGVWFNAYAGELDVSTDPRLGGGACGVVGGGTGFGSAFGLFGEYKSSDNLAFGLRGLFENRSGALTADLPSAQRRLANGELEAVESQHRFELDLHVPSLELYAAFRPFSFPIRFTLGPKIGITSNSTYEFAEELGTDNDNEQAFANGTKRQIYASGNADRTFLFGFVGSVGYELQMAQGLHLIPELALSSYINSALPGESAPIVAGARPSIAIRYTLARPLPSAPIPPTFEPVAPPPPLPTPAPDLVASVEVSGVDISGANRRELLVILEERIRRREIALLPYVFFPENSAEIPSRYTEYVRRNDQTIVEQYRGLLDLLGQRMRAKPEEKIQLTGTNGNEGKEKDNLALSRRRAESVAEYLVREWSIDRSRIQIEARNLPEYPSNSTYPGGREENRRVEIIANGSLLSPIAVEDTIRSYTSPGFRVQVDLPNDVRLISGEVRIALDGKTIRSLTGVRLIEDGTFEQLTREEAAAIGAGKDLTYQLSIEDEEGRSFETEMELLDAEVVEFRRDDILLNDQSVSVSTPILFSYNSAELTTEDKAALLRFREELPDGAKLTVTGHADDLGEIGYNRSLSQRRAEAVASLFTDYPTTIIAAGEEGMIGGNDTPEGRFYARTVTIEVTR